MKTTYIIPSRLLFTASVVVLCGLSLIPARVHAQAPQYTVTVLGSSPGYKYSLATGINASAQVVGENSAYGEAAVVWTGTTPAILLSNAWVFCINDSGQWAGFGNNGPIVSNGTTTTVLDTFGDGYSDPLGINDAGQVVGFCPTTGGLNHAVVWNGSTPTDLGTLSGGTSSYAFSVNDTGQIVGYSAITGDSGWYHAVVWNGTTPTDLGTLSGLGNSAWGNSAAYDINASGQVAGFSNNYINGVGVVAHAVVWNGTTPTDLGDIGGPGSRGSYAVSINDQGDVVGIYENSIGNQFPFLYTHGTMYDLNSLLVPGSGVSNLAFQPDGQGAVPFLATGHIINNRGQIAANGYVNGNGPYALLLTPVNAAPVPVPVCVSPLLFLLLGGTGMLGLWRRRKMVDYREV